MEARNLAHTDTTTDNTVTNASAYIKICIDNINQLETKMESLQKAFDTYTSEDAHRENIKKISMALAGTSLLIYAILYIIYRASSTADTKLSTSNGMFYDGMALFALLSLIYYAGVAPIDRPFKWQENLGKVIENTNYKSAMAEYENFIVALTVLTGSIRLAYGENNPRLQQIYDDFDREVNAFKSDKQNLSVSKVNNEMEHLKRLLNFTKQTITITKPGYAPSLFTHPPLEPGERADYSPQLRMMNRV